MSRVVDSLIAYRILRMFSQKITDHPAFQMGIVDKDGVKLKEPSGAAEMDAYTMLDKLAFKIKRALYKSPDRTARRLLTFAAAIALLRENRKVSEMDDDEFESLIDLYSQDEKVIKEARLLEMGRTPFNYFALDEEIANAGGPMTGGNIAGPGTDSQGEPGRNPSMMPLQKRKKKKNKGPEYGR